MTKRLGEFEQLLLFAVLRLGEDAYGARIAAEVEERTGRGVSPGAVYTVLDRLEKGGLVTSRVGAPTGERGGRRRKIYDLQPHGAAALHESWRRLEQMAEGVLDDLEDLLPEGGG